METFLNIISILVAGTIQYARSQGVQVTTQDIMTRVDKHLEENSEALAEIAKRHLTRFSGDAT